MEEDIIVSTRELFRRAYKNPIIVGSQLIIASLLVFDYFFSAHLIKSFDIFPISLAIIATTLVILWEKSNSRYLANYIVVQVAFTLLFATCLIFIIPAGSPYNALAYPVVLIGQYWLGFRGFVSSYSVVFLASLVGIIIHSGDSLITWHGFIVFHALLLYTGIVVGELFRDLQKDRRHLQAATNTVEFEREQLESLINSMTDAVIATDEEGIVTAYNGAALELLDTNKSPLKRHFDSLIKIYDTDEKEVKIFGQDRDDSVVKHDDWHFVNQDDEKIDIYMSLAPIITESSAINNGFILLLRDITTEKTLEEQRDDFISIVSHELRTPLAITEANLSTSQLPVIKNDPKKQQPLIEQAYKNVLFLSDLVNDITTLSRAERGLLEQELETFDPGVLVLELEKNSAHEAAQRGLKFKLEIDESVKKISSNRHRVKEIVQGFLTNAIKYTEKGSVTLKLEKINDAIIKFSVIDTGIGISTSDQKHIFKKFYRSEDFRTRDHNGTGLGLYIGKKLVELVGGKIGLSSELNKGSTFWLELPINAPSQLEEALESAEESDNTLNDPSN